MPQRDQIILELLKAGFSLVLLLITWVAGQRIIAYWDIRKKRQEFDIATTIQFQQLYGEFKEVSKMWKLFLSATNHNLTFPEHTRWELLKRATAAESKAEAIVVKLVTERKLSGSDCETLGFFRQSYQQLREAIRDNKPIAFSSYGPEYHYFNDLACSVAHMISSNASSKQQTARESSNNLRSVIEIRSKDLKHTLEHLEDQHVGYINDDQKELPPRP
jgi:YesN/AraC family two-component response regulator